MKVQVYDNLDTSYPTIAFYSKRGKVVLNFADRTLVVSEKVREEARTYTWRTVLKKRFKR